MGRADLTGGQFGFPNPVADLDRQLAEIVLRVLAGDGNFRKHANIEAANTTQEH